MSGYNVDLNVGGVVSLNLLKGVFVTQILFQKFCQKVLEVVKLDIKNQYQIQTNKLNKTNNLSINDFRDEAQIENRLTSIPFLRFTQYNLFQPTLPGYTGVLFKEN